MRRSVLAFFALAVLLGTGCGGAEDATAGPDASAAGATDALATASRIAAGTEANVEGAATDTWGAFEQPVDLLVGHAVRTDATGLAQIDHPDGSLTRLDVDSIMEIVELAGGPDAADVVIRLDVGRTWHRVQDLGADGRFEVETSVATAAVRGTAFVVQCLAEGACVFTVVEGQVEVTAGGASVTLGPFQRVEVAPDGTIGEVEDLAAADVLADPWIAANLDRDEDAGFAAPGGSGGDDGTGAAGAPGPPTSDGVPVPVDAVLAMDGGSTSTLLRPDGSTVSVPIGGFDSITALWTADGGIGWVSDDAVQRMLPDGGLLGPLGGDFEPILDTFGMTRDGRLLLSGRSPDGGALMRLFDDAGGVLFEQASPGSARLDWPAVSPDGSMIAAVDFDNGQFVLIDVATGTTTTAPADLIDGWVRWSPDNGKVVFTSNRSGVVFAGDGPRTPFITVIDAESLEQRVFEGYLEGDFLTSENAIVAVQSSGEPPSGPLVRIDLGTGATTVLADGPFGSAVVFHGVTGS